MFAGLIKSIGQSVIQDLATTAAGLLMADGFLSHAQEQGFIGSVCFLGMLVLNAYLQHTQKGSK